MGKVRNFNGDIGRDGIEFYVFANLSVRVTGRRISATAPKAGRTVLFSVDGTGRRLVSGRRRSLPGRAYELARAKGLIIHFSVPY